MTSPLSALRPRRVRGHRQLLTGSAVLVAGAAIQALSGAAFWLIAAKLDTEDVVGGAGKLFTSVLFVTYLAGLGLPVALARYAATRDAHSDANFTWGALATTVTSIAFGLGYVVTLHGSATGVLSEGHGVLGPLLFAVAVAGAALSMIVDVRCMTARRWNLVLVRITVVGLARFPLLLAFRDLSPDARSLWLFAAAAGPVAISGVIGAVLVPKVAGGRHRFGPRADDFGEFVHYSGVNYVSTLAYQAPYFLLPVIVLANVSDSVYASFNVAWGIVAVVFYVPTAIGQALLAEGGRDGAKVHHQLSLALSLALALMVVATVGAGLFSDVVITIYGEAYAEAARILPTMVAAGIPWAITSLYLTEVRILHRHVATVAITTVLTAAIVIPALLLIPGESGPEALDGARWSWLLGNTAAAFVAVIAVRLTRRGADPSLADEETAEEAVEVGITLAEHTS